MESTIDLTMATDEPDDFNIKCKDSYSLYFREINKYPVLSDTEELELVKKAKKGNLEAKEKLIKCNLKLVVSIAKKFKNQYLELLDLIQEGNFGLMKALEMYDYSKGTKFSTYATFWIRQYIFRAIQNQSDIIRIPVYAQEILKKCESFKVSFYASRNRYPSNEELAEGLEISISTIERVQSYNYNSVSLNIQMPLDSTSELGDFLSNGESLEDVTITKLELEALYMLLNHTNLSDLEKQIIQLRFFSDKKLSFATIGAKVNRSGEGVRQILLTALNKLKCASETCPFI